jgi:hypothetical protein
MGGITTVISGAGAIGLSALNRAPTVYSFLDLSGSMAHPLVGSYVFTGQGVGQITITFDHERDFHEIDVYGTVLVGQIPADNGKIQIQCQQSSNCHSWLGYAYTKVMNEVLIEWARMNFILRNVISGDTFEARGVSFTNFPEEIHTAQGGLVTWVLSFADGWKIIANPSGKGQMSAIQKQIKSVTGG